MQIRKLIASAVLAIGALAAQVTPYSQALAARQGLNSYVQQWVQISNQRLTAQYTESCNQWIAAKGQLPAGTAPAAPIPPISWRLAPHSDTPAEATYDAAFPGLPARVDDVQDGPFVAPQCVDPATVAKASASGPVVHVGALLRNGQYASYPDDNMPANYITVAPDGVMVRKVVQPTPFGNAAWYQAVQ